MMTDQSSKQQEPNLPGDVGPPCPECHTGVYHLEYLTYFTWLNDELVTVPNFPSWVCDVCGRRDYDTRAISWLNTLLSPNAGRRPVPHHRRSRPSHIGRPQPQ